MSETMEHDIAYYAKDGRLCEPSDGKKYRMRELIKERERLGRPLTEAEARRFEETGEAEYMTGNLRRRMNRSG